MLRKQDAARERPEPPPSFAAIRDLPYEERSRRFATNILPYGRMICGSMEVIFNRNYLALVWRPKSAKGKAGRGWTPCFDYDRERFDDMTCQPVEYYYKDGDEQKLHPLKIRKSWKVAEEWGFINFTRDAFCNFGLEENSTQGYHRHE
ncbi:MAG: hypothetical protein ACOYMG_09680 [Candidatus Methylumidiphilus sp.]